MTSYIRKLGFIWAILVLILCTSCMPTSTRLGLGKAYWAHLSVSQRQKLEYDYKQVHQYWKRLAGQVFDRTHYLMVTLEDGRVMMPPFEKRQTYQKTTFIVYRGQCREVWLVSRRRVHPKKVALQICYRNNQLILDTSHYRAIQKNDSARLYWHPLWEKGLAYPNVNSQGYVRLHHVKVNVHCYETHENALSH